MTTYAHLFPSPAGDIFAAVDPRGHVVRLLFAGDLRPGDLEAGLRGPVVRNADRLRPVVDQVGEYFRRERREFELDVALEGSAFQRAVWGALRAIPYGSTLSYRDLAARLGRPSAIRAVGRANATNPICLVVPCHRVIGADGSLTGFGGGLEVKRMLLELEGSLPARLFAAAE